MMTNSETEATDRQMTGTYVAVIVVEVLVLLALWIAGLHFSSL
ncbi:MAG TPA: hypothetical protein VH701_09450 [Vicinamibacterales bacterium]|jgi:hypothetical protein